MHKIYAILGLLVAVITGQQGFAQGLADSCKLRFGTNIAGISDWGTEMPFVDMMKYAREWYTKDNDNPSAPFNSNNASYLTYRSDGYPTHLPQTIGQSVYKQSVATIWGVTEGWEAGNYVVLYDGTGVINFWGNFSNLTQVNNNRITFTVATPSQNVIELRIDSSLASDPIRNIRIIKDTYETTYTTDPFNPVWLSKVKIFNSIRFMDWGRTNNWSQAESWEWQDTTLIDWNNRARYDYYTWTTSKGVPYEMMVRLMNEHNIEGWVCVPHKASNDYIQKMATFFKDELNESRNLTIEYSNEIWNWMFGQTQWLNQYGCIDKSISWPEGIVPYIQNCMDIWTQVWQNDLTRLKRAVGLQGGWLDVSQRIAFNMNPNSFDIVSPTSYFGISDSADAIFDALGPATTAGDIAQSVRASWHADKQYLINIKTEIADSIGKTLAFYEGGQHLTAHPFGIPPTYGNALLDIQRDTAMYNLYHEWFDFLRTLQSGDEPLQNMNFSFISARSSQYGSWGILETQYQDTAIVYAPKYQAILENIYNGCWEIEDPIDTSSILNIDAQSLKIYPNPTQNICNIASQSNIQKIVLYDVIGKQIFAKDVKKTKTYSFNIANNTAGVYFIEVYCEDGTRIVQKIIKE